MSPTNKEAFGSLHKKQYLAQKTTFLAQQLQQFDN